MAQPFSSELKDATDATHRQAEGAGFVRNLLAGALDRNAVAALLAQQLHIYRALETALEDYRKHPLLAGFIDPALARTESLQQDMAYHFGPGWQQDLSTERIFTASATRTYAAAIAAAPGPEFLLANHYVRYLGDLSGGQIIHRMTQRHYGIPDDGLNFYVFEHIPKLKRYKDEYRARLDALDPAPHTRRSVVDHAVEAFEFNHRIFLELGERYPSHPLEPAV